MESPVLLMKNIRRKCTLKNSLKCWSQKNWSKEFSYLVDPKISKFKIHRQIFRTNSGCSGANIQCPWMRCWTPIFWCGLYPKFRNIVNRIQYDEYHLYPVDKHLLRAVQTVKKIRHCQWQQVWNRLCDMIYGELKNKRLLLWAVLLHDIGKGRIWGGTMRKKAATLLRKSLPEAGWNPRTWKNCRFSGPRAPLSGQNCHP